MTEICWKWSFWVQYSKWRTFVGFHNKELESRTVILTNILLYTFLGRYQDKQCNNNDNHKRTSSLLINNNRCAIYIGRWKAHKTCYCVCGRRQQVLLLFYSLAPKVNRDIVYNDDKYIYRWPVRRPSAFIITFATASNVICCWTLMKREFFRLGRN